MSGLSTNTLEAIFHIATYAAFILGGLSITAALISAFSGYEVSERIQKESDEKISLTNARAEEARAVSAQANERAAQAEARAAEAKLELERFKAPRGLTQKQQDSLRDKLKHFHKISVDILKYGETAEIVQFATALTTVFANAGWSSKSYNVMGGGAATGVLVMTRSDVDKRVREAADAIISGLQENGIASGPWAAPPDWFALPGVLLGSPGWDKESIAPIRVIVGSKP